MDIPKPIPPNTTYSFTVPQNNEHVRIDRYVSNQFPRYSRSFFQRLIDNGHIALNGIKAIKSASVTTDDTVTVHFPPNPTAVADKDNIDTLGVRVVHTDEHFFIISKPAGLIVHAPHAMSTEVTLVDWLLAHDKKIGSVGSVDRPGIVHRLDKDTSGLMIIPRTNWAHGLFGEMFKSRTVQKTYHALVHGHPSKSGSIDHAIGRDPHNKIRMKHFAPELANQEKCIRSALTHYRVIKYFDAHTLIETQPATGRTHQIRVHCAAIGHSIVSDHVYGTRSKQIPRHALHAQALAFTFNNKSFSFTCDLPDDFTQLIATLKETASL